MRIDLVFWMKMIKITYWWNGYIIIFIKAQSEHKRFFLNFHSNYIIISILCWLNFVIIKATDLVVSFLFFGYGTSVRLICLGLLLYIGDHHHKNWMWMHENNWKLKIILTHIVFMDPYLNLALQSLFIWSIRTLW